MRTHINFTRRAGCLLLAALLSAPAAPAQLTERDREALLARLRARPAPAATAELTDAAVQEKIEELQKALANAQQKDGAWPYPGNQYPVGITALCVLALKQSGLPNDHPAIQQGVRYILKHDDGKVYSEGLVACALELVDPRAHSDRIKQALKNLIGSQTPDGAWSYGGPRGGGAWDNSNTQFAILGLAAAERCGFVIPLETKKKALRHWRDSQAQTGGWGYTDHQREMLSMTCAGVASLSLLGVSLATPGPACGQYKQDPALVAGIKAIGNTPGGGGGKSYTWYAIERVGMFLDLPVIGGMDWYRAGAQAILSNQSGGYGAEADNAFNLLFLAKGFRPIAIAQWQWEGDWNNDIFAIKNWLARANKDLHQSLDYVQCTLDDPASPAAKASLVFVNGHNKFAATDADLAFIRAFLNGGGTLVAEGCCNSRAFIDSFAAVMTNRLYPNARCRFDPIPPDHPAAGAVYKLNVKTLGILELTRPICKRQAMRVLLLTHDISCALNGEKPSGHGTDLAGKLAINLLAWALASKKAVHKLDNTPLLIPPEEAGSSPIPEQDKALAASRQPLGHLIWYSDDKQVEDPCDPDFLRHLAHGLTNIPGAPAFDGTCEVDARGEALFSTAALFVNGHEAPRMTTNEIGNLRTYLQNGGFIFASCCCNEKKFDRGFRAILAATLPNDTLEAVPADDPLWDKPVDCRANPPAGNPAYARAYPQAWAPLLGIRRAGRWIVIYSPVDFCCALGGENIAEHEEPIYDARSALGLAANILSYALSP